MGTFKNIWIVEDHNRKLKWITTSRRLCLAARTEVQPQGWDLGVREEDMIPIQKWCEENNCGRRTSFDTFQFKNKKQMTMFLLRWA